MITFLSELLQRLRRNVLGEQQLQPVEELGGRRLLLQSGHVAQLEEDFERLLRAALFFRPGK